MALILCMNPTTKQVGWRNENSTSGFQKFRKDGNSVGSEPPPSIALNFTGAPQQITLPKGKYKIECWGAGGGDGTGRAAANTIGKGGYTSGIITLTEATTLWVYIGRRGSHFDESNFTDASFNGGGFYVAAFNNGHSGGGGGGATDIRIVGGDWDNITSLRSRIMIAGGGGGQQSTCGSTPSTAGHGGGLTGGTALNSSSGGYRGSTSYGGSQTAGGTSFNMSGQWVLSGSFGKGANSNTCGAGAGGGYYGGGATYTTGGGGGSSFISGHPGCNAINASGVHTGQPNHFSGLIFTNTSTQSGIQVGNGSVAITPLQSSGTFLMMDGDLVGWRYKEF